MSRNLGEVFLFYLMGALPSWKPVRRPVEEQNRRRADHSVQANSHCLGRNTRPPRYNNDVASDAALESAVNRLNQVRNEIAKVIMGRTT
jgi:hypothetical protein